MLVDRTTDNTFRISGSYRCCSRPPKTCSGERAARSNPVRCKTVRSARHGGTASTSMDLKLLPIFISKPDRDFIEVTTEGRFRNAMDTTGVARS